MNSRNKGKVGELELRDELRKLFPHLADGIRRGQQYNGIDGQDVVGIPGWHVECKRVEKLNIESAVNQAACDAKEHEVPVVCHRRNRGQWLMTFPLSELARMVDAVVAANNGASE